MFKKITAICLAFVLVISMAAVPVFASGNQNSSMITKQNQASIVVNDKKNKNNKNYDNDYEDLIEDVIKKFLDSAELQWAQKSIEKMGFMGILDGTGNGYFMPKNNVTHAEAIAMVLKLAGYEDEAAAIKAEPSYFKGKSDKWSYGYLQLALNKGILIPEEDGSINPKTPAKRHEVAKYVVRALGLREEALQNMNASLNYNDASSIPSASRGYVYVISDLGIMQGSNTNEFQPNKPITRAEMAVILDKAENGTYEPGTSSSLLEGAFTSYDSVNYKLTMNINNKAVVYNVLPNAPVYKDSAYYPISLLKAGDVIKVIVDSQNRVIFIEFKQDASTNPSTSKLYTETVLYANLPQVLKDKVDALKYAQSFTAYQYGQSIYLIAARGQMLTGGYTIDIKDVYRETNGTSGYNLKAVVEMTDPSNSYLTQAITYPYEVVKLNYFNGIDKVNFVNASNTLLAQTYINTLDTSEVINGRIDSVDATNRIIRVLESDGIVRAYSVPSTATITLNSQSTTLSALAINMPVAITRIGGVITSVAAQYDAQVIETINGKIDSVDTTNRIIRVLESDGIVRAYSIPSTATITLSYQSATLSALAKNMTVVITKVSGVITSIAAQYNAQVIETINGKLNSVDAVNRVISVLESDNIVRTYLIPANVAITLNSQTAALSSLAKDMPIVITKTNGIITALAATSVAVETINGKIDSVDTTNRILRVLENDGVVRAYSIPSTVTITLNTRSVTLASLIKDMPVVLTRTNGVITKVEATNIVETINGRIDAVDAVNRILRVLESDNVVRAYLIPSSVQVTLNNQRADLLTLAKDMTIVITRTNGVITKLAATNITETIQGKIDSVDTANNIVRLLESDNVVRAYTIPTTAQITLDNQAAVLSNLAKDMKAVITKVNGTITRLAAERDITTVEGIFITTTTSNNKTFISVRVGNIINAYEITSNTQIYYNNQITTIQNIPYNSTIVIKIENGVVTEIRNK